MPDSDADLVTQLFASHDNLDNIDAMRKKLLREKSVVDSQLQVGIRAQVQLLSQGISQLADARDRIGQAGNTLRNMHDTHKVTTESVTDFDRIQQLSTILANFDQTQKFVNHFRTFHEDLRAVKRMMDEDKPEFEPFEIEAPMRNLIPIHYTLDKLRDVQEEAYGHLTGPDATNDTKATVRKHYEPLNVLVARFDETLFDIAACLLEILRTGDRSLVVRTAKIIDFEERKDLIARLAPTTGGRALKKPHTLRHYPTRFFDKIAESVHEMFDNCMDQFSPETAADDLLANLDWIYQDLAAARELLVPCVPKRWQIFDKYVEYYHKEMNRLLETVMRFEPPAQTLLLLLQTVKDHYATLKQEFGIPKAQLQPPLLDGREKEIYDEYLHMLVAKLKEWYRTIALEEQRPFRIRATAPETHPDGALGLEGHTTISKLVSQQLDVAADSGQGRIVAACVDACCEVLMQRQQEWIQVLQEEVQKELSAAAGDDVPPGLFEYIMALANDQDRAYSFLDELSAKWSEPLSRKYKEQVAARFEEAQQGYQEVTKACLLGILRIIFGDARKALDQLYVDSRWYKGTTTHEIVDTLADFATEAQGALIPDLFDIFMFKLCSETVLQYLKGLAPAKGKLHMPKGKERIQLDVQVLFKFFTREEYGMDAAEVEDIFQVFAPFCDALDRPVSELTDPFEDLRSKFWDAPLDLYECIVGVRRDIDAKSFKAIMASVRAVAVQTQVSVDDQEEHTFLHEFRR